MEFVILAVVVDDMMFCSNSYQLLEVLKSKIGAKFDVKLLGVLRAFIGWEIVRRNRHICVTQYYYARELLERHGLDQCNAVLTPFPLDADIGPAHDKEHILQAQQHSLYRAIVGGLLIWQYVQVLTSPSTSPYYRVMCTNQLFGTRN